MKKKFKNRCRGGRKLPDGKSPLKQTDRHHKSPGGDLCIRQVTGVVNKTANVAAHAVVNAALAVVQEITPVPVPQVLPLETWWG